MYFLASKRWKHICPYCQSMFHLLERVISGINTITDSYYTENFPGPSLLLSDTVSIHKYLQMFKRDRNEMIQCHTTQLSLINSPKYIRYLNIRQKDKKSNSLPDPTKKATPFQIQQKGQKNASNLPIHFPVLLIFYFSLSKQVL